MHERWEYLTKFMWAHAENRGAEEYIQQSWPDLNLDTAAGRSDLESRLRAEGHERVRAKIDAGEFENWLLDLRGDGEEEVILEEKNG